MITKSLIPLLLIYLGLPISAPAAEPAINAAFASLQRDGKPYKTYGETFDLPAGCEHLCRSAGCEQQAFSYQDHVLALQFHLETTPDSATDIISHSDQHKRPGRFVQSVEPMLADPRHFDTANRLMARVVDRLAEEATGR